MKRFAHIALGGTFDHLHAGHRALIDLVYSMTQRASIGIAEKELYDHKKLSHLIQAYQERKKSVKAYLASKKIIARSNFFPLHDIFGTCLTDKTLEAIVVTRETYANARRINKARIARGMSGLQIIRGHFVKGENKKIIRSEQIRLGEMDRTGRVYRLLFKNKRQLVLNHKLRRILKKPLGEVLSGNTIISSIKSSPDIFLVSVGDVVSKTLYKAGITPSIQIIDYKINRKPVLHGERLARIKNSVTINNPAGALHLSVVSAFRKARNAFIRTHAPQQIIVRGEEDLTALAAILFSPLGSVVLYGQPGEGVVIVRVTEDVKAQIYQILYQCAIKM